MSDTPVISGHAGYTMGPVARWVCVDATSVDGRRTVAYVDTFERANRFISTDAELTRLRAREAVLEAALRKIETHGDRISSNLASTALATLDVDEKM